MNEDWKAEARRRLFNAVAEGRCADLCNLFSDQHDQGGDGTAKALDASLIVEIANGNHKQAPLSSKGIVIKGARIRGDLDCEGLRLSVPLRFEDCVFENRVNLQFAMLARLDMKRCQLRKALDADGCVVEGDVDLSHSHCLRPVSFPAATIKGRMILDGAQIDPGSPNEADNGPAEEGERRGHTAYHAAFNGALIKVENGIFFRDGFRALGVLDLHNAKVRGNVEIVDAHVRSNAAELNDEALDLSNASVDGYVFFRKGANLEGRIDLFRATVGLIEIKDSKVGPVDGQKTPEPGLDAENILVRGHFVIAESAVVRRGLNLKAGIVQSLLQFGADPPKTDALREAAKPPELNGVFDLSHSKIGRWSIDFDAWNKGCRAKDMRPVLNSCDYQDINSIGSTTIPEAETLIRWLASAQGKEAMARNSNGGTVPFYPQPAEQLISVLRRAGHFEDLKKVVAWKRKNEVTSLPNDDSLFYNVILYINKSVLRAINCLTDHGYSQWKLWLCSLIVVFLSAVFFQHAYDSDAIMPAREVVYMHSSRQSATEDKERARECRTISISKIPSCIISAVKFRTYKSGWPPDEYTSFNALAYSLDVFLPIVNLHEEESWLPASGGLGTVAWWVLWIEILLGWAFSTLVVASLTGIIKRE